MTLKCQRVATTNLSYTFKKFQGPLGNLSKTFKEHVDFKHFQPLNNWKKIQGHSRSTLIISMPCALH